jgi:hypothetical protein
MPKSSAERSGRPVQPANRFKVGHVCRYKSQNFVVKTRQASTSHKRVKYWSKVAQPAKQGKRCKPLRRSKLLKKKLVGGDERVVYVELPCGGKPADWQVAFDDDGLIRASRYVDQFTVESPVSPVIVFPHKTNSYKFPLVKGGYMMIGDRPVGDSNTLLVPNTNAFRQAVNRLLEYSAV